MKNKPTTLIFLFLFLFLGKTKNAEKTELQTEWAAPIEIKEANPLEVSIQNLNNGIQNLNNDIIKLTEHLKKQNLKNKL